MKHYLHFRKISGWVDLAPRTGNKWTLNYNEASLEEKFGFRVRRVI
jgi:hypothetical protein